MYTIYALVSTSSKWIYVGFTSDLNDRMKRHQSGYEKTTAPYRPFSILQLATAFNSIEARRIEKWYKTSYGKQSIRLLLTEPFYGGDSSLSIYR